MVQVALDDGVTRTDGEPRPVAREAQPFAYLAAPNKALYRDVMRAFARAKDRFIVHLRPEDVAAELGIPGDEQVGAALDRLAEWGNLRAEPDTGRVTTVEDFHRKRFLYQLTPEGQAAEEAIAYYEEAIGRRGALQSVALADIADHLAALLVLAREPSPDPDKVHHLLLLLVERFTSLAENAQAFMSSLRRAIDFSDEDVDGFLAYKEQLIGYINRFIADLANSGARIANLLLELREEQYERLLALAAAREARDAAPDGPDGPNGADTAGEAGQGEARPGEAHASGAGGPAPDGPGEDAASDGSARARKLALETWHNRWRGLRDWFLSPDSDHPSQAKLLRSAAVTAIKQLIEAVGLLNERRSGRSDRSADFRTLARWFAEAPDDDARHRLWRASFGLCSARHLSVTQATVQEWEEQRTRTSVPWREAPPIRISPQLRKTGSYERRGRPNRVTDRSEARRLLQEQAEREAAEVRAARRRLVTPGPVRLSELAGLAGAGEHGEHGEMDAKAFRLFLGLLGDALAARAPGESEVKTTTADGALQVLLSRVDDADGASTEVRIPTEDGVLTGPDHIIEISDLTGAG